VMNLGANTPRPYRINDRTVNLTLELRYGKSVKAFVMDRVSNAKFNAKEFDRLSIVCTVDEVRLPSKRHLEKKAAQLNKLPSQAMTESDISAMVARKNQFNQQSAAAITMERSRLIKAKTLAMRRQDYAEVTDIEAKLKELPVVQTTREEEESLSDKLARVNERNRKANLEAVRKAELLEAERKRRERKLANAGGVTPSDPSARLKTIPRTFNDTSRSATPNAHGTPVITPQPTASSRPISPLPSASSLISSPRKDKSLEASIIESIEVDLGDF